VVPVGLGLGPVFEIPRGASLNTFVEPQYLVIQRGAVVQLPVRFR